MGHRIRDLTGFQVGRLVVLHFSHVNRKRQAVWLCRCRCGHVKEIIGVNLTGKTPTISCSCRRREASRENIRRLHNRHCAPVTTRVGA